MSPIKDDYQDVKPVTLLLSEQRVTSNLYCGTAKGMEAQVATLVEAFLVEVYRCRVCQFTSGLKNSINTHIVERHNVRAPSCPGLPCLGKDDGEGLEVEMGVGVDGEDDELEPNGSTYNLEEDLHSGSKDGDDQMDRMSFLLPMYGMLPNISPRSCEMGLGSNSDVSLHVAQTCEVSTLFEEGEEGRGEDDEEENVFRFEGNGSVSLSCPMGSVVDNPENQAEETAQSAHLMTLGLCRISTAKAPPTQAGTLDSRLPSTPVGQEGSDTSLDEKSTQQALQALLPAPKQRKSASERALSCVLCQAALPSRHLLEIHLKCHNVDRGFKCPECGWMTGRWAEMELHWRGHGKRRRRGERERERGSRPHGCQVCPRAFRSAKSRDAHEQRHSLRLSTQACFKCLHCNYRDKSWDKLHGHILLEHKAFGDRRVDAVTDGQSSHIVHASRKELCHESSQPGDLPGSEPEKWFQSRKRRLKGRKGRRDGVEKGKDEGQNKEESAKRRGRKEFCCSLCNRKFSTKLTMRRHMGIHQGDKPFQCPHCHYSTRLKASLMQHLRVHTGEKPFKCPQCPYASIDSSSLRRHSRTHTQEKPYCCQYCPYSSIQKKSLDLHARRHHTGESFPCHLCQYSSPDRQLLVRHLRKHHTSEQSPVLGQQEPNCPNNSTSTGRTQST